MAEASPARSDEEGPLPKGATAPPEAPRGDGPGPGPSAAECAQEAVEEGRGWRCALSELPPLPQPRRASMLAESLGGCALVFGLIAVFVGGTFSSFALNEVSLHTTLLVGISISLEAAVAAGFLLRILLGDPGVIKRSSAACFPAPKAVVERLTSKRDLDGLWNLEGPEGSERDSHTYCIRCLVWRPLDAHHCGTCQRCVVKFDHHCGVLGRCIAGRSVPWRRQGNLLYFYSLIAMLPIGLVTFIVAIAVSFLGSGRL